jgi:ATP-dependent RNA helicase DDX19/DBP5
VNNRSFAIRIFEELISRKYKPSLIMGGEMSTEERNRQIERFRKGDDTMVITTDLLSRGFDMPTIQLVINFDVPQRKGQPEYETYMHRIGRAGRFGMPGIAVTLFDREEDEKCFFEIVDFYKMQDKVHKLDGGSEQVAKLLDELPSDDAKEV